MLLPPNNYAFAKALLNLSCNGLRNAFGGNWTAGNTAFNIYSELFSCYSLKIFLCE